MRLPLVGEIFKHKVFETLRTPWGSKMPVERYHGLTIALLKFFLPWALAAFYIISIFVVFGDRGPEFFALMGAYLSPIAGKTTVIPVAVARGFEPYLVASYIVAMDVITALFLAWNWDLVLKVPFVGDALRAIMSKGIEMLEKRRWLHRLAFTGIVLYMAQPLQPGGSIGATVVGRIIGLGPDRILYAITIGSAISSFGFAYATTGLLAILKQNVYIGVILILTILVIAHHVYHNHIVPLEREEQKR